MWNIVWLMEWSLLRIWSNAKTNKATPVIPRVCENEKVGSCTFSHSQLLSLCFFICQCFLALSHLHSHSHPCSTFLCKMDLNSNLTLPEIFKQSRFLFKPDSASPQTAKTAKPATGCSGSSRELDKMSRTTESLLSGNNHITFIERRNGKRNNSCQVIT